MKGIHLSFDGDGNPTHAVPSRRVITIAASILPNVSQELVVIFNKLLLSWNTFPCPCEVDPNLPVATKHAITLVLLADFHGRDPNLFVKTGQPFFTTLLDWCCPVRTQDPHGYREGMAAFARS